MCSADRNAPSSMIGRLSRVLDAYRNGESRLSLSELSRRTGIPKTSMFRIAGAMTDVGLLEREGDEFRLGLRLFELGQQASRSTDLRQLALPYMARLRNATHQTVHLAVLEGNEVVYVQILRSRFTPELPSRIGGRLPAHATGVGKALLAFLPHDRLDAILNDQLPAVGPCTITDPDTLRQELSVVRRRRLAYEREESSIGLACVASPILDATEHVVAALSVSVDLDKADIERMAPAVVSTAMGISRHLGSTSVLNELEPG